MKHEVIKPARLQRYKEELLALRARLAGDVNRLIESIPHEMQAAGDLSNVPTHNADRDSDGLDKEVALVQNEGELLAAVEAALERIENGTFGPCENCEEPIAEERLDALPYVPLCIRCAQAAQAEA
jgi:RNA polymerase-binding transcription factor DksA